MVDVGPLSPPVPRSHLLVDGALTDDDLAWVDAQLSVVGLRAVRAGNEGMDIARARATGRRPAYLDYLTVNEVRELGDFR